MTARCYHEDMILALSLGFVAAIANAASSLLQRHANHETSDRPLLLRSAWLSGFGVSILSFLLQAAALQSGSLAAVQTVLALELALVVLGSGVFFKAHIGRQEWLSVGLLIVGTIGLIVALDPRQETSHLAVEPWQWIVALVLSAASVGGCLLAASRIENEEYQGALLGIGTGIAFGVAASLLKGAMLILTQTGVLSIFRAWQLYVALSAGLYAFWMLQRALRTGKLVASQPGITLADPFVAITWGGLVYGEQMNTGAAIGLAVLAALVLSAGAILLAHSPALKAD